MEVVGRLLPQEKMSFNRADHSNVSPGGMGRWEGCPVHRLVISPTQAWGTWLAMAQQAGVFGAAWRARQHVYGRCGEN